MAAAPLRAQSLEERLIYWSIVGTWAIWLIGGLYILAPALGWSLVAVAIWRRLGLANIASHRDQTTLPMGCRVWISCMSVMAGGLVIGHLDYSLGAALTLKSFIGWMKGWALMAVFIYIGATMRVRPAIVYRATNILGAQTLALTPIFLAAAFAHVPRPLYISPLQIVGGPGPEYFAVELYNIEPETGAPRWRFFAPWAPAASFVATIGFVFALNEKDRFWKSVGLASTLVVCAMSQSRLAIIAIPTIALLTLLVSNLWRPMTFALGSVGVACLIPFLDALNAAMEAAIDRFKNARASSSRVRSRLQSIAIHRWKEAPIFGHGVVERGPHLVEYMPIGSHHTWNGLLFVKGVVGFLALAVPMTWSFIELIAKAQADRVARAGVGVMLALILYSFGENLEILVYLFWPGVIIIGCATRRRFVSPWHAFLGRHPA